jgi:hypothetical protein
MARLLHRRLQRLESKVSSAASVSELNCLVVHLLDTLAAHKAGGTVYKATDREVDLFAAIGVLQHADRQAASIEGVHDLPSGARVTWARKAGSYTLYTTGRAEFDDLSESFMHPFVERMPAESQPAREEELGDLLELSGGGGGR